MVSDTAALDEAQNYFRARQFDSADAACRRALLTNPADPDALCLLGRVQMEVGRPGLAAAFLGRAVALRPGDANLHFRYGVAAQARGDVRAAEKSLEQACTLAPRIARYQYALGTLLLEQGQLARAATLLRTAIELDPTFADAHLNLGIARLGEASPLDAMAHWRDALALKPDQPDVHSNVLLMQQYEAFWSPAEALGNARDWARRFADTLAHPSRYVNTRDPNRRLRIGYVSADFRQHSVAYLIEPVVGAHDRSQVEVFCYSNNSILDATTERIQELSDRFLVVPTLSNAELAEQIRRDEIDILVDLSGHTAGNRLLTFAERPAPIQATWLGYSGTTGMEQIDYILVDSSTCPAGSEGEFAENLVRLDPTYLVYQPDDLAGPSSSPTADVQPGEVVFASFNNAAKISTRLVDVWARLLRDLPRSKLLLKSAHFDEPCVVDRFTRLFSNSGVSSDQLEFRGRTDRAGLLDLYRRVNIALDPFPYNGCLTSLEALWMGVPLVTLRGDRFVGRMGASLVTAVGLRELVADSEAAYVATARALAMDTARLADLRRSIRGRMQRSVVCDAAGFTARLEHAYRTMWHTWCGATLTGERRAALSQSTGDRT